MPSISCFTVVLSSSVLLVLLTSQCYASLAGSLKLGTTILHDATDNHVKESIITSEVEKKKIEIFQTALKDMCAFYDAIKEYRNITAYETSNVTKAIRIVLIETYTDSCKWLKIHLANYTCDDINSADVTEVCAFVNVAAITKELSAMLPDNNTGNFAIDCNGSECDDANGLLKTNCEKANSKIKCSQQ